MTIYTPTNVNKELPPYDENFTFIRNGGETNYGKIEEWDKDHVYDKGADYYFALERFVYWLKPIEVESLILHVQNEIASQRGDIKTIIEQSIKQFVK